MMKHTDKQTHTHQLTLYHFSRFLQFNPNKPNKFHLKLFMVSEHESGYICGFSVYMGKTANKLVAENATLDTHCSIMTKTVMGLLQRTRLLDNHRTVFFDNYFRYFTTPPLNLNLQSIMIKKYLYKYKIM